MVTTYLCFEVTKPTIRRIVKEYAIAPLTPNETQASPSAIQVTLLSGLSQQPGTVTDVNNLTNIPELAFHVLEPVPVKSSNGRRFLESHSKWAVSTFYVLSEYLPLLYSKNTWLVLYLSISYYLSDTLNVSENGTDLVCEFNISCQAR